MSRSDSLMQRAIHNSELMSQRVYSSHIPQVENKLVMFTYMSICLSAFSPVSLYETIIYMLMMTFICLFTAHMQV